MDVIDIIDPVTTVVTGSAIDVMTLQTLQQIDAKIGLLIGILLITFVITNVKSWNRRQH